MVVQSLGDHNAPRRSHPFPTRPVTPPNMSAVPLGVSPTSGEHSTLHPAAPGVNSRAPLSVVIPTLNEAARIESAIADLHWADEVIVVDGGSADATADLAARAGAHVITLAGQTIAAQRNAGIEIARNTWILALDADERVSTHLRAEIARIVVAGDRAHAAYRIKFRNRYLGRELRYGPWGRDWHIRLFTRERRYVCRRVHEHLEPIEDVGLLAGTIVHEPYRDLAHHVSKIVKYAQWGAEDLHARGRRASYLALTVRPAWRFVRDYIVFSGWRDGLVGFVAAALSAFAAFLKYAVLATRSARAG